MHFKFASDDGLYIIKKYSNLNLTLGENHMNKKRKLEPAIN